jgi:poly-gamma-glutamate capsule biosynthesis protein CapA/YwtB (metallophosphatase superfamily)
MKPVKAFTPQGKFLIFILRFFLTILHWVKGKDWQTPPLNFHEDPRYFTFNDILFFAYKYYFKPPVLDDAAGKIVEFFTNSPPQYFDQNHAVKNDKTLTITAAGDLMPYKWIQKQYCPHLWDDIENDFFNADITFANLETPINIKKPASLVPEVMLNDMNFNANEEMFDVFQGQKFTVLSTANNHSLDMGETGVEKTIEFLEQQKVLFTGTARSEKERLDYPVIEKKGIRVAFIAYTFSMNKYTNPVEKPYIVNHLEVNQPDVDLTPIKELIFHAKSVQKADFIVLSLHYGNAYQAYPGAHIVENTKRIFQECGVDVILGGHAHNVQPMASYDFICPFSQEAKHGFVLFSFGDFIAYDIFTWGHLSVYLKLKIGQNTEGVCFLQEVTPVPIYACGSYNNKKNRDLRLLNAHKTMNLIKKGGIPNFMTSENVEELKHLMAFYDAHFALNLNSPITTDADVD